MLEKFEKKDKHVEKFKQCPDCNLMNSQEENFCTECGAELPPADEDSNETGESSADIEAEESDDEAI